MQRDERDEREREREGRIEGAPTEDGEMGGSLRSPAAGRPDGAGQEAPRERPGPENPLA